MFAIRWAQHKALRLGKGHGNGKQSVHVIVSFGIHLEVVEAHGVQDVLGQEGL